MPVESAPILFLIFNRADLTSRSFERIREIRPKRLFIAADGPRNAAEAVLCREAWDVTRRIDWDCEVHRLEREENLGCKMGVSSAISWFFEHVEEGIILEDDCLPDPSFFWFCTEMLVRYRCDERVGMISGDNFQKKPSRASYYFSRYPHVWGWATWRRFWKLYDVQISDWEGDPDALSHSVKSRRVRQWIGTWFDGVRSGKSWAYQLVYLCLKRRALCVNPGVNLVANIGFDERATHTGSGCKHPVPTACSMPFPLVHPGELAFDEKADDYTLREVFKIPPRGFAAWLPSWLRR